MGDFGQSDMTCRSPAGFEPASIMDFGRLQSLEFCFVFVVTNVRKI